MQRDHRGLVLGAAAAMVLAHLAVRAWAVYPAWFYSDDFRLVHESAREPLTLDLLLAPYDAQLMPWGRFVAWIGAAPDHLSWPLLASTSLAMQAVAAVACTWMLMTLFGCRWRVLVPLAFYLSTAMTMPAFLWWAAALNQLPLQAVFFASVATWVKHLRTRQLRWLTVTLVLLATGLAAYVKVLLVFPVLAFLALGWFAQGGPARRVVTVMRRHWPAVLAGVAGGAAFLASYAVHVPQLASGETPDGAAALAEEMVGTSFVTALLGGPWRWDDWVAPAGQADPPAWSVHLSWVVVALVVAYLALRRERTLRAWVLLGGYLAADYLLLLTTRAQVFGSVSGTEYRYLTDAACATVLALGLASMELRGAEQTSRVRAEPLLTRPVSARAVAAATIVVAASGLWSSVTYARLWHTEHPTEEYLSAAVDSAEDLERVDLANQTVPADVMAPLSAPYNTTEALLPMLTPAAEFPVATDRLHVLDATGHVVEAELRGGTSSLPGPVPGCGWKVQESTRTIPLRGPTLDLPWWLRMDYLASGDTAVRVQAGETDRVVDLQRGLNTVYVQADGAFPAISLGGLDPGVTVCVDEITAGLIEAGGGPRREDQP